MTRKSKSFILSLLIHLVLAVIIFSFYKISSASNEEEHLCACCSTTINLNTIQTSQTIQTPVKNIEEKPVVEKVESKQASKKVFETIKKKELAKPKETVIDEELKTQELQAVEQVQVAGNQVVQVEQNATNVVQNTKLKDVDTHCKAEVIAPKEIQKDDDYLSLHVNEIISLLKDNLYYPRRARQQGIEGVITVKFTLSKEAKISNIEVVESKHEILSRAAVETIENLEEKLPKPDEELTLTIPINYDLK